MFDGVCLPQTKLSAHETLSLSLTRLSLSLSHETLSLTLSAAYAGDPSLGLAVRHWAFPGLSRLSQLDLIRSVSVLRKQASVRHQMT